MSSFINYAKGASSASESYESNRNYSTCSTRGVLCLVAKLYLNGDIVCATVLIQLPIPAYAMATQNGE